MGIFSGLDVNKVIDKIDKSVDTNIFSNQERSELFMEYYKLTLNENTTRSKTRRLIAILIISVYLLTFVFSIALTYFKIDVVDQIKSLVTEFKMNAAFMLVVSFFFGSYMLDKFMKDSKKKNKKE